MNISYNWLRTLVKTDLDPTELATRLTDVGLAVEGIEPHGEDFVLDIDLTSNRPDCLSHLGIARELAAATGSELNLPAKPAGENAAAGSSSLVTIKDAELCNRFTARVIRGVKIGPSPSWLVNKLEAVGERSINNVADITNFVMLELGQPMHAFDLDKLQGGRLVVRRANTGEQITTLDGVERTLDSSMLAICDAEGAAAIAGIMGGLDSSISDHTHNVLVEVAFFDRGSIRATSRALNMATEASYRFERGVDIENLRYASERASQLICELAGGTAEDFVDVYPVRREVLDVRSPDISRAVGRLTGLDTLTDACRQVLDQLGVTEQSEGTYRIPSWRHDIAIEEDLVEEIARHVGYTQIVSTLPASLGAGEYQPTEAREKLIRQTLVSIGFNEALTYSFIGTRFDDLIQAVPGLIDDKVDEKYVTLQDSVIEGSIRMRPTIVPGLLDAVRLNFNHQRRDIKVFEIGKVFASSGGETPLPTEVKVLTIAMSGSEMLGDWVSTVRELDFFDLKGAAEAVLCAAGITAPRFSPSDVAHLLVGQAATVTVEDSVIGYLGRVSDEIAAAYRFRQDVYVGEFNLDRLLAVRSPRIVYSPLSKYPGVKRDITLLVPQAITYDQVKSAIVDQQFDLCSNVSFVDVYEGKGVPADQRSLTVRLEYRSTERTLLEEEVDAVHTRILESVRDTLSLTVPV